MNQHPGLAARHDPPDDRAARALEPVFDTASPGAVLGELGRHIAGPGYQWLACNAWHSGSTHWSEHGCGRCQDLADYAATLALPTLNAGGGAAVLLPGVLDEAGHQAVVTLRFESHSAPGQGYSPMTAAMGEAVAALVGPRDDAVATLAKDEPRNVA